LEEKYKVEKKANDRVCLCCGSPFDDNGHRRKGPYRTGPYKYVCEWCWQKSFLYFPDKEVSLKNGLARPARPKRWTSGQ